MTQTEMKFALPAIRRVALAAMLVVAASSHAADIDLGNSDLKLDWDNTIKYSLAARLHSPDATLLNDPNSDDGDRNFRRGLISNRVDLLSEMDLTWERSYGIRLSGAAWYDAVYNKDNANPGFAGGAFSNNLSVPYNQFTRGTRTLHGREAELLDAFLFGKFDLAGMDATLRLGRYSQLWGESFFFGANAIAGGQQPVDVVKLLSVPNTPFKEAIRPVPQLAGQLQLASTVSIGAYYQFRWSASRIPGAGSYFATDDISGPGSESLWVGPGSPVPRVADMRPKNSGQGGLSLRWRVAESDIGFYAIRFHDKTPQVIPQLGFVGETPAPVDYYLAYQQGITAFGTSISHSFGDFNIAAEASIRHNMDLASTQGADVTVFGGPPNNNTNNPAYAVGNTAHFNISTLATFGPSLLWQEAALVGEFAWNRVLKVTENPAALDPNGTRDGWALREVLEPTYRAVAPGLDVGVPIGLGYAPKRSRPLAIGPQSWIPAGGGDFSIGLNTSYLDAWRGSLSFTHYFGAAASQNDPNANNAYTWKQSLHDRDFIAASLRYSF